jgi:hypothetical protein
VATVKGAACQVNRRSLMGACDPLRAALAEGSDEQR